MELVIAILLVILGAVLLYIKKTFYYWQSLGVPQFPIKIPYGNFKGVMKDHHMSQFLIKYYKMTKQLGSPFSGLYMFMRPILMVCDLDLAKTLLLKDFAVFPNRGFYHNEK